MKATNIVGRAMIAERHRVIPGTETKPSDLGSVNSTKWLLKILQATPEKQAAIDRVLAGDLSLAPARPVGPLLLGMSEAARLLGVSRATLWRMIGAGRLQRVEVLPGSFRVRRADVEAIAGGQAV